MRSHSRLIFCSNQFQMGRWRCYPDSPLWKEENVTGPKPLIAFPRSAVFIHQTGHDQMVTSPNQVVFYNSQQTYRRAMASEAGDHCEYVYLEPSLVGELFSEYQITTSEDCLHPFDSSHGPCRTNAFLMLRSLCHLIQHDEVEPLFVEETFLRILPGLLQDSVNSEPENPPRKLRTCRKHREQVEQVKEFVSRHYTESVSLEDIAIECDSSPFHICRIFKSITHCTILKYVDSLRLRIAFQKLIDSQLSLAQIALDCGFSSQSHMSNRFRREFSMTPGFVRSKRPVDVIRRVSESDSRIGCAPQN